MNIFPKKTLTALVSVALLLLVGSGSTLAYLFTNTDSVENTFTPAQVSCAVVENDQAYTSNTVNITNNNKSNVTIKNTSNVPAYIRAAIVVTWKNADGTVYAVAPKSGDDYKLDIGSGWIPNDEFYYYNSQVVADGSTSPLITLAQRNQAAPEGYYLSIEILAEAIQAEGMGVTSAQDAWAKAAAGS